MNERSISSIKASCSVRKFGPDREGFPDHFNAPSGRGRDGTFSLAPGTPGKPLRGLHAGRMMSPDPAGAGPGAILPIVSLPTTLLGSLIMARPLQNHWLLFALLMLACTVIGGEPPKPPEGDAARVYGEWRIRVKPDQGPAYDQLIEKSGLPLFRQAGGRMVGWWKTLIGDLYEHVTIWEYDNMAGFEKAVGFLSKSPEFARFVAARDPLLSGEESRFMRLASGGSAAELARARALCGP